MTRLFALIEFVKLKLPLMSDEIPTSELRNVMLAYGRESKVWPSITFPKIVLSFTCEKADVITMKREEVMTSIKTLIFGKHCPKILL